jgi:hypothetical protein
LFCTAVERSLVPIIALAGLPFIAAAVAELITTAAEQSIYQREGSGATRVGAIPGNVLTAELALDQGVAFTAALPSLCCSNLKSPVEVCVGGTIALAVPLLLARHTVTGVSEI